MVVMSPGSYRRNTYGTNIQSPSHSLPNIHATFSSITINSTIQFSTCHSQSIKLQLQGGFVENKTNEWIYTKMAPFSLGNFVNTCLFYNGSFLVWISSLGWSAYDTDYVTRKLSVNEDKCVFELKRTVSFSFWVLQSLFFRQGFSAGFAGVLRQERCVTFSPKLW